MTKPSSIPIQSEADVRYAAELASHYANEMGLETSSSAELALAVSEIAQNAIRYGGGGKALFSSGNAGRILQVMVKDEGAGILNLNEAMRKGYTTSKGSLGVGLDVARRCVDEFQISTSEERGTQVTLKKFLPIPEEKIDYGVVSLADENYAVNGDDYLIHEYDGDKVLMAVLDGTGEGYAAHTAAYLTKKFLIENYRLPLDELVIQCHSVLKKAELERGVTIALGRLSEGTFEYIGVGDTHAYLLGEEMSMITNHDGIVGLFQLPTLKLRKTKLEPDTYILLCTDGIKSNLWLDEGQADHPQKIANFVFREFHRDYGDVTVLVARYKAPL
ncbi:MAG: ATP-binding protein [Cytophagales bacterium]|nr:ATP-binding protein [Cytophagales bacterium]